MTAVSLAGNLSLAVVLTLIGPLPFIPLEPSVPLVRGLMCLVGVGFALVMVSTFSRAQTAPIRLGYQRDLSTYLLMSGLWSGTLYLGGFLGPTVAGVLVDAYGFRRPQYSTGRSTSWQPLWMSVTWRTTSRMATT